MSTSSQDIESVLLKNSERAASQTPAPTARKKKVRSICVWAPHTKLTQMTTHLWCGQIACMKTTWRTSRMRLKWRNRSKYFGRRGCRKMLTRRTNWAPSTTFCSITKTMTMCLQIWIHFPERKLWKLIAKSRAAPC